MSSSSMSSSSVSLPIQSATDTLEAVVEAAPASPTNPPAEPAVHRPRRLRRTTALRRMVREMMLTAADLSDLSPVCYGR